MRKRAAVDGISVHAISGTHVVMLAFDATEMARQGLLGFAIKRNDLTENNEYWLNGSKVFKSVSSNPSADYSSISSLQHPIQSFLWSDYSAKPCYQYRYIIRPIRGVPSNLRYGTDIQVEIETETEKDHKHSVYFNRGAIASQAYARKYQNTPPSAPNNPADQQTAWLSRGLLEAALEFINQAQAGDQLRCAAYEFQYDPIINAFKGAAARGVDVKICYEAGQIKIKGTLEDTPTTTANKKAIKRLNVPKSILIPRTKRKAIPHNKFIVFAKNGVGIKVWTGSTNFTCSGFLGQSNVGHIVKDEAVANVYLAYWQKLSADPESKIMRDYVMQATPDPNSKLPQGETIVFSPRPKSNMLNWYADKVKNAQQTVMFTAAFGVNTKLVPSFAEDKDYLRFILTEKSVSSSTKILFDKDKDLLISKGSTLGRDAMQRKIPGWELDKWFHDEELYRGTRGHIFYVHTKYMLIDILGDNPKVFSGSANFSSPSLLNNDENMMLICGNKRVADIYLTEFDRLFRHFWFRQTANKAKGRGIGAQKAKFLTEDDSWTNAAYEEGHYKQRRRMLFS
jgi:phosphatidylserine/phosphatidylglycerophosphate/cardiolipin synthase-like enzyme